VLLAAEHDMHGAPAIRMPMALADAGLSRFKNA
jgi:hypothetical protein